MIVDKLRVLLTVNDKKHQHIQSMPCERKRTTKLQYQDHFHVNKHFQSVVSHPVRQSDKKHSCEVTVIVKY